MQNMKQDIPDFIVVDDDEISNIICEIFIKEILPTADIRSFTDPEVGVRHIESTYQLNAPTETILILDINMPKMSGWQFLDEIQGIFGSKINCIKKIFMLSSSVDPLDKQKSNHHELVTGYIEKPLSLLKLQSMLKSNEAMIK